MPKFNKQLQDELISQARQFRREATAAEELLWENLHRKKLGNIRFKRQHVFQPFIVDFYCPTAQLVIELDGKIHERQKE